MRRTKHPRASLPQDCTCPPRIMPTDQYPMRRERQRLAAATNPDLASQTRHRRAYSFLRGAILNDDPGEWRKVKSHERDEWLRARTDHVPGSYRSECRSTDASSRRGRQRKMPTVNLLPAVETAQRWSSSSPLYTASQACGGIHNGWARATERQREFCCTLNTDPVAAAGSSPSHNRDIQEFTARFCSTKIADGASGRQGYAIRHTNQRCALGHDLDIARRRDPRRCDCLQRRRFGSRRSKQNRSLNILVFQLF